MLSTLCGVVAVSLLVPAAYALTGITVDPTLKKETAGEIAVNDKVVSMIGRTPQGTDECGWLTSGTVTIPLQIQDIREGVISFWMLPLTDPVTGIFGWQMSWPDSNNLLVGGDLSKNRTSLRISVERDGTVAANHLSWHRKSQWLEGVKSEAGAAAPGQWVHIAYGVGKDGQRLWINGKLAAQNAAGKESVSWPYQIRFEKSAAWICNVDLRPDASEYLSHLPPPPQWDTAARNASTLQSLLEIIQKAPERRERLGKAVSQNGPMPYETARLNVLYRSAPWLLFHLIRQNADQKEFAALRELPEAEARWTIAAMRQWDQQVERIEQGAIKPVQTPAIDPDVTTLTIRNGAFWQNGRPVYLVGPQSPRYDLIEGMGFSFSGHTFGPGWTFSKEQEIKPLTGRTDTRNRTNQALKHGYFFEFLYSGHVFPGWAKKKWPELDVGVGFNGHDMVGPRGWAIHEATLRTELPCLAGAKNLLAIDLANEPAFNGATSDSKENWIVWLKKHHETLAALNDAWGTSLASWDQIDVPEFVNRKHTQPWEQTFPTDDATLKVYGDWSRFNLERVNDWYAKVNRIVKEYVPQAFTYTKMIASPASNARMGIDVVANVRLTDLGGSDSWWLFRGLNKDGGGSADAMSGTTASKDQIYSVAWENGLYLYDLITSANRNAPATNAEFHLFQDSFKAMSADNPNPPPGHWDRPIPANHFYSAIWQQAVHGQAFGNIWLHWPRNNLTEHASGLDAASRATMDLNRLGREVHAIHAAPRKVGMLWGLTPILWDKSGKWYANVDQDWRKLWAAMSLNGIRPRFIFERDLAAGVTPDVDVLIVAGFRHMDAAALKGLAKASASGLKIWSIGENENFQFDTYNRRADTASLKIESVLSRIDFDRDAYALLRQKLAGVNLLPTVQVEEKNMPGVPRVHWESASLDGRTLMNLCNYGRETVQISIHDRKTSQATDLITGETLNMSSISLEPEQVRLVALK